MDPKGCGLAERWLSCPLGRSMQPWGEDIITAFFLPNVILGPHPLGKHGEAGGGAT